MNEFSRNMQIRWADLDPNFHLRHSVYYDWGAFCRIEFLNEYGLTSEVMNKMQFGPIIFREECIFRREIRLGDEVCMDLAVKKGKRDFSRWTIQHQIFKSSDLAAIINLDGAWINLQLRKLFTPPEIVHNVFNKMPRAEEFQWLD